MESQSQQSDLSQSQPLASRQPQTGRDILPILGAAGLGAAIMYFLDPDRGTKRRHLVRDQFVRTAKQASEAAGKTSRDLANHARGVAATARAPFAGDEADDTVIAERVRAELGRAVSHPGAIEVSVMDGSVILTGPVLESEADRLISQVRGVRGVKNVESRIERHGSPGNIPGLQGVAKGPAKKFELLQENWTPAARLMTGLAGGALASYALRSSRRGDPLSALLGLAGVGIFLRAATNKQFDELIGFGAERSAVTLQKTISINAPVDEVFAWFTEWERLPEWMSHVREVTASGERGAEGELTHWVVDGPAGTTVKWNAVTTKIEAPTFVAWKTVEGSPIGHAGTVKLLQENDGTTRVDVHMSYNPIAGALGHTVAKLFGRDPKHQFDDDLSRLKATIETGRRPHDAAAPAVDASQVSATEAPANP